jgi:hypothetical protein
VDSLTCDDGSRQYEKANRKGSPSDPKRLPKIEASLLDAVRKMLPDSGWHFLRIWLRELRFGKINDEMNGLMSRQLTRPVYNEFFSVSIEVPLTKRIGVKRMKELRDFLDADLYRVVRHLTVQAGEASMVP